MSSQFAHPAFAPGRMGPLALRNRIIKTATYEGMVAEGGLPSRALLRHHRELAAGGVAMTTVAYCAVSPDGRTFEQQMVMRPDAVASFRRLVDAVHAEGAAAALQLGHAGGFTKNVELEGPPKGPSVGFNAYGALKGKGRIAAMTRDDMHRVADDFAIASALAFDAGFDAIELHLGHGYLLSQFLSPARNQRKDAYGGSTENRLRFPLEVITKVREVVGPDRPILAKVNLDDGVPNGLHVEEAIEVAKALEGAGVSALVLSGGLVSHSAMYLLRGGRPLREMVEVEKSPVQKVAIALFGSIFVKAFPFEPRFFLPLAREVRRHVRMPLVLLGGIKTLEDLGVAMNEGFEFVAMGRALLHTPDLVGRFTAGTAVAGACEPCNRCITEMDRPGGVCCTLVPAQLHRRDAEVAAGDHVAPC